MKYYEREFHRYYWRQFLNELPRYRERLIEGGVGPEDPFYRMVDHTMWHIGRCNPVSLPNPADNAEDIDYEAFIFYLGTVGGIAKAGDREKLIARCEAWLSRRQAELRAKGIGQAPQMQGKDV